MAFVVYDIILLVLFILFISLFLFLKRDNLKREGLLFLYRTSWGIKLINKSGSEKVSLDLNSGKVILDTTITNGIVEIRGIGEIENNTTGTTQVSSDFLINPLNISNVVWDTLISSHTTTGTFGSLLNNLHDEAFGKWALNTTAKTLTLYKSDGTTILKVFNLTPTSETLPVFVTRTPA